ncbi:MAG: glutathione S-transferase family protein [Pseudomonadota bacterium]
MNNHVHIYGKHISNFVRSVQLCCEELAIPYTLGLDVKDQTIDFKSPQHFALNPFGKIPILLHGEHVLYETQTICRYLVDNFSGTAFQPKNAWQRAQVDQWCSAITLYIDKWVIRDYLLEFVFPKGENGSVRMDVAQAAMPAIITAVKILEDQLGANDFLVGNEYSLADILLAPILFYLVGGPNNSDLVTANSPLRNYVAKIQARPAAKKVLVR